MENSNLQNNRGTKSRKALLERCFWLLDFLRKNTDKEHTVSQTELRNKSKISLGDNETLRSTVEDLAEALNCDEYGVKNEDEWVLVYKAFADYYGENSDRDEKAKIVNKIYYNHVFSNEELTDIINALRTSKAVDKITAEKLVKKLKNRLAPSFYSEPKYMLDDSSYTDSPKLAYNINLIQKAIENNQKISFNFNYYSRNKSFAPPDGKRSIVSPHYIKCSGGRYYLIGGFGNDKMCFYRIDLMTDIKLSKQKGKPIPSTEKNRIEGLPVQMYDGFNAEHLFMSYGKSIMVRLKITPTLKGNKETNYTPLHDAFGSHFTVLKDGTVNVKCTEFGIINWALQYSSYVEVLEPESLRQKIAERVKELNNKYLK